MYPLTYLRPSTVEQAVAFLRQHPQARPLSGGMTLVPTLKQRLSAPSHLVDLSRLPALQGIARDGEMLRVGAATRHADVASAPDVRTAIPALARLAGLIGDQQVRNRGTLGGSIANNDPGADYPAAVLGLGATVVTDHRRILADDFFTGMFETALAPAEIVTAIEFPVPVHAAYVKHRHPASGFAVVGVFIAATGAQARVAVTGAGPCVFRWAEAEQRLAAVPVAAWTSALLDGIQLAPQQLNEDLGATAAYRAHLAGALARRALAACSVPLTEDK